MAAYTIKQLELDGRTLEGGGQLLRLATGLSALKGVPIKISHIRGNRSGGGGLKSQHLACVRWLAQASNAEVTGAEKGSSELVFRPGQLKHSGPAYRKIAKPGGRYVWEATFDVQTAGSTGLGLQAILPFILSSPPREANGEISPLPLYLTLRGGTNVSNSPSYDYITQVMLPTLSAIGLPSITPALHKRGWSHGGTSIGSFTLEIPPPKSPGLQAFSLYPADSSLPPNKPSLIQATFIAPAAAHAALRTTLPATVQALFGPNYTESNATLTITCEDSNHPKRFYLLLVATVPAGQQTPPTSPFLRTPVSYFLGRDWLYDRKIRPTHPSQPVTNLVTQVTADLYKEWASGAWVDEYLRDQLVVFRALAEGGLDGGGIWGGWEGEQGVKMKKEREPSLHARTAEWVVGKVLGHGMEDGEVEDLAEGTASLSIE